MANRTYTTKGKNRKVIDVALMSLITLFMLMAPFYRGLFFRANYIPAVIIISIIFTVITISRFRDNTFRILGTYLDISVLLIPAAYLISFFFAANAKDAFDTFLLYCSSFMVYKVVSELSFRNERYKNIFIDVIIFSAFLLSFTFMLHIGGFISIKGALEGRRLYGLYQYANTSASVLGVGIVLSLNRLMNEKSIRIKVVYQMILTALISSFVFTLSRGGFLVLAGVLVLNFFLVKARTKLQMIVSMVISFLSSSILIYKFFTLPEEGLSAVWIYYLLSIAVSAVIIFTIYTLKNSYKLKFSDKAVNMSLIAMAAAIVLSVMLLFTIKEPIEYRVEHNASEEQSWKYEGINLTDLEPSTKYVLEFDVRSSLESKNSYAIAVRSHNNTGNYTQLIDHAESVGPEFSHKSFEYTTLPDTESVVVLLLNYEANSYTIYKNVTIKDDKGRIVEKMEKLKYLPEIILNRLTDINLSTQNASLRIYFVKDALKIIRDFPIAGAGGGAWENLYRHYQSTPYNTTEVHNFYVQYVTEVGIIGFAALVGMLILLVLSIIKSIKFGSKYLYVYLAAMLLLLHSTIDFNLSLASVNYILFALIGIINSDRYTTAIEKNWGKQAKVLPLIFALAVLFASSSIYYGMRLGIQGARTSQLNNDANKAIELYEKAAKLDRYNSVYRVDMAQLMNKALRETKSGKYYDGITEEISQIRKYEPHNHQYTTIMCSILYSIGKFEEASHLADIKVSDEPMLVTSYNTKIDTNYQIASYYIKSKKLQEAVPYLEKVLKAKDELAEVNSHIADPMVLEGDYPKKLEAVSRTLEMIRSDLKK